MPNPTDDLGNPQVDFVWGPFPLQPNDQRGTNTLNPALDNHSIATEGWSSFPGYVPNYEGDGDETPNLLVPSVIGLTQAAATTVLQNAGFTLALGEGVVEGATEQNNGTVATQTVTPGSYLNEGSTITVSLWAAELAVINTTDFQLDAYNQYGNASGSVFVLYPDSNARVKDMYFGVYDYKLQITGSQYASHNVTKTSLDINNGYSMAPYSQYYRITIPGLTSAFPDNEAGSFTGSAQSYWAGGTVDNATVKVWGPANTKTRTSTAPITSVKAEWGNITIWVSDEAAAAANFIYCGVNTGVGSYIGHPVKVTVSGTSDNTWLNREFTFANTGGGMYSDYITSMQRAYNYDTGLIAWSITLTQITNWGGGTTVTGGTVTVQYTA